MQLDAILATKMLAIYVGQGAIGIWPMSIISNEDDTYFDRLLGGIHPKIKTGFVSTPLIMDPDPYVLQSRIKKEIMHEAGHLLYELKDHNPKYSSGKLCPMSRGGNRSHGERTYVGIVVDQRGLDFCDECVDRIETYQKVRKNKSQI